MALQVEWETPYGIVCNNAYAIVRNVEVSKEVNRVWHEYDENEPGVPNPNNEWIETKEFVIKFRVKIWSDKDAYDNDKSFIGGFNGRFNIDTAGSKNQYNLVKQCYQILKTAEGWTNATDC